jgi:hypothetical protein
MTERLLVVALLTACSDPTMSPPDVDAPAATPDAPGSTSTTTAALIAASIEGGLYEIKLYAADATGDATPVHTFQGSFDAVRGMRMTAHEIFIAHENDIEVFDLDSTGAQPKRTVWAVETQLRKITNVALYGAEMFTASGNRILVHPIEATGHTPPLRIIEGPRNYTWVEVHAGEIFASSVDGHVDVLPETAVGVTTPTRSIDTGSPVTGFCVTDTELFVTANDSHFLRVFPVNANGGVEATRSIGIPTDGLWPPSVVGSEIFVADKTGSITVHAIDATGPSNPLRTITNVGSSTTGPVTRIDVR